MLSAEPGGQLGDERDEAARAGDDEVLAGRVRVAAAWEEEGEEKPGEDDGPAHERLLCGTAWRDGTFSVIGSASGGQAPWAAVGGCPRSIWRESAGGSGRGGRIIPATRRREEGQVNQHTHAGGELRRHFGVWQATALNVTMIVGAGIFISVPFMLQKLP